MSSEFITWLKAELSNRNWKQADLSRRANLDSAAVSMLLTGRRKPGEVTCTAIARAFGYPPEVVMRQAGLLPPLPESDTSFELATHQLQSLPAPLRKIFYDAINAQYTEWENGQNKEPKTQPRKPGGTGPLKDPTRA